MFGCVKDTTEWHMFNYIGTFGFTWGYPGTCKDSTVRYSTVQVYEFTSGLL